MMLNSSRDDWEESVVCIFQYFYLYIFYYLLFVPKILFYFSMLSSTFYTSPLKRSGRRPLVRVRI